MSDARRYTVWPEPRSRSMSLEGSRPSVPHGTNFFLFVLAWFWYIIGRVISEAERSHLESLLTQDCVMKVSFDAGWQHVEAFVKASNINEIISYKLTSLCAHLGLYELESDNSYRICVNFWLMHWTCTKSPAFSSLKETISPFVTTDCSPMFTSSELIWIWSKYSVAYLDAI